MKVLLISLAVLVGVAVIVVIAVELTKRKITQDLNNNYIPDVLERAVEKAVADLKSRAHETKKELADVKKAIKEVGNQLGDVPGAISGKKRAGRK